MEQPSLFEASPESKLACCNWIPGSYDSRAVPIFNSCNQDKIVKTQIKDCPHANYSDIEFRVNAHSKVFINTECGATILEERNA
jgi:hypothetical protein